VRINDESVLETFWLKVCDQIAPSAFDAKTIVSQLSALFILKDYSKNTYLLSEGECWTTFSLISTGIGRMTYNDLDGNEHNKNFFTQGQCFWPILERYQMQACDFTIQCIEDSTVFIADANKVKALLQTHNLWDIFYQKTTALILEDKLTREHDLLKLTAKERYQKLIDNQPDWVESIADYHLASYLGISPVSLSRLKASLD